MVDPIPILDIIRDCGRALEANKHIFFKHFLGLMKLIYAVFILLLAVMTSAQCQQTAEELTDKGYDFSAEGVPDLAIKCFDRALALDSNFISAMEGKSQVLRNLGRYEESIKVIDNIIDLNPNDSSIWSSKGSTLMEAGKYVESVKAFDESIRLDPDSSSSDWTWVFKGRALAAQGKYDEAIKACDEAIRIYTEADPINVGISSRSALVDNLLPFTWTEKGDILAKQGKYLEAIDAYDESLIASPEYYFTWGNKGDALKALGRTAEANAAYAKEKERELEQEG